MVPLLNISLQQTSQRRHRHRLTAFSHSNTHHRRHKSVAVSTRHRCLCQSANYLQFHRFPLVIIWFQHGHHHHLCHTNLVRQRRKKLTLCRLLCKRNRHTLWQQINSKEHHRKRSSTWWTQSAIMAVSFLNFELILVLIRKNRKKYFTFMFRNNDGKGKRCC